MLHSSSAGQEISFMEFQAISPSSLKPDPLLNQFYFLHTHSDTNSESSFHLRLGLTVGLFP